MRLFLELYGELVIGGLLMFAACAMRTPPGMVPGLEAFR